MLKAVWNGGGAPVFPDAIFREIYHDDPNGGPSSKQMYTAFKVALCHLREKLKGSGVSVETVGYNRGFSLKFHTEDTHTKEELQCRVR